jgi:single-stranded DNA-specific DHH superfamily exonuclease
MTSYHIGFRSRRASTRRAEWTLARQVVELFEADSFEKAREIAAEMLDSRNRERQKVQQRNNELALAEYAQNGGKNIRTSRSSRAKTGIAASSVWRRRKFPTNCIARQSSFRSKTASDTARRVRSPVIIY